MQQGREFDDAKEKQCLRQLAAEAKQGDSFAFEKIIAMFRQEIHRMVYARIRSSMDAEDATQEIFMKAYEGISGLKDDGLLKAWLFRIALNKIRDIHRKRALLSLLFINPSEKGDESEAACKDDNAYSRLKSKRFWDMVDAFMKGLGRMEKEVFYLKYIDQLSIPEISQILEKNENTVKTHLYRAVRKFQNELAFMEMLQGEF